MGKSLNNYIGVSERAKEQFEKEIWKYVGPKETARLWRYVVIN